MSQKMYWTNWLADVNNKDRVWGQKHTLNVFLKHQKWKLSVFIQQVWQPPPPNKKGVEIKAISLLVAGVVMIHISGVICSAQIL